MARKKVGEPKIKVGNIADVSGEVNIAAGDIYKGFTAEQVSVLITQITSTFQPKKFDGRCPYKGLDVFEEEDAELFFGREKLVEDLVNRVKESRTVFITGPSGSGKSSLVRAGLIHALKEGAIKGSERWMYETMKPGRDPIAELARVVSSFTGTLNAGEDIRTKGLSDATVLSQWCEIALKDSRDKRAVIFVDQFEEAFTQINKETERVAFLNLLTHAATVENGRVFILFAMRSDFVSNCATYSQLNDLLNQQFMQIGAMQPNELVSAIAQPALRVGLHIDPDLIAQIIKDMQGEPGALPLMQFALKDLFDSQQEKGGVIALTLNDYLQRGGIHKALERHADASFAKLDENEQELARSVFSGLIEIGRGTQDTKRTALFDELIPANAKGEDILAIIQKLANDRLITTDEQAGKDTVTISHEKLIEAWPWLKKLINENRNVIALQNEIANDAKQWDENKRDASYLYTGARLAIAEENLKNLSLSENARYFLDVSMKTEEDARRHRARAQRRIITGLIGFSSAVVALLIIALSQLNISRAQQLGVQAQVAFAKGNLETAALFAYQANQIHKNSAGDLALRNFYQEIFANTVRIVDEDDINSVAWSADGRLAFGARDGTITIWDFATGQPAQTLDGHTASINSLAWSAYGRLASGSEDGTIIIWNLASGKPAQTLEGDTDFGSSLAWSTDGRLAYSVGIYVIIWDLTTGQRAQTLEGHSGTVTSVAWSTDDRLASGSGDGTIIIWDLVAGEPTQTLQGYSDITSVAWSTDGRLASGTSDGVEVRCLSFCGTVTIWDLATGKPAKIFERYESPVNALAWSADGQLLASVFLDGTIMIWDFSTEQPVQTLVADANSNSNIAWSSADGRFALASSDGTIHIGAEGFFRENICWFIDRNMTLEEWLTYQGPLYVYQPACPNLDDPTTALRPIQDFLEDFYNPRDPFEYPNLLFLKLLITWKGRTILFAFVVILLVILIFIFWAFYKIATWLWRKIHKRLQEKPRPA